MQFPVWQCVNSLYEDIGDYLDDTYSLHDDYTGHWFDLDKEGFIQIVNTILYMMIEKRHICLYWQLFNNCYFNHLDVPVPIDYFVCHHGIGLFDNITDLINHFSVQQRPKTNNVINC